MDRQPVVANQFYPGDSKTLFPMVDDFLAGAEQKVSGRTRLAMVPHAGYVYSGAVCGMTLGMAQLHDTILLLGPNHTGMGKPFSVWDEGRWLIPGGGLAVDLELGRALLDCHPAFERNHDAHVAEHSLEGIIPFLYRINPAIRIVAVSISEQHPDMLCEAGEAIASMLTNFTKPVSMVVSSDMNHFASHEHTKKVDSLAIEKAVALDPDGMYVTVRQNNISMCGVLPMTVGLHAANAMGAEKGALVAYDTSARASGDYERVVGYAGILVH